MMLSDLTITGTLRSGAGAVAAALQARAVEWDLALTITPEALILLLWEGELRLTREGERARLTITAPERRLVQVIRGALAEWLEPLGVQVDWPGARDEGALAPGLALMRLVEAVPQGKDFLRVTLEGPEATRFAHGGWHFRLLVPPEGRVAHWPRLNDQGRAIWPEGADALHRAVYTLVGQEGDRLWFDIVRHDGSPSCDWAARAIPGAEVGIIGPGGGTCPEAAAIWAFGDATALPALRRMQAEAKGTLRLWTSAAGLPDAHPAPDLLAALTEALPSLPPGTHVWFAGHEAEARAARALLAGAGLAKRDFTAVAYWS